MNRDAPFAAENARSRKNRIGSIGSRARSSQPTNAARSTAPATREPTICGLVQPSELPFTSPQTRPRSPTPPRTTPGTSRALSGPYDSRSCVESGSRIRPIGTFSQKIHCHEMPSTTAPPTSGPIATAKPAMPDHAPSAAPRRSADTAPLRIVSVSGVTIAPPRPCSARAAMSHSVEGASAAIADAPVKMARPIMNIRFRPKRSPSAAPISRKTAHVNVYALTIHSSCSIDAPRSTRITGSAVDTTRLSSTTMNRAIDVMTNVQMVRVPAFIVTSLSASHCDLVIDYSAVGEKREGPSCVVLLAPLGQASRPRVRVPVRDRVVHRREHVHEHPLGEEARDRVLVGARDRLDVVDEPAVPAGSGLADLVVDDRRGVGLELPLQHRPVALDELSICGRDRAERVASGRAGRSRSEEVERPPEALLVDGDEESLLRPE